MKLVIFAVFGFLLFIFGVSTLLSNLDSKHIENSASSDPVRIEYPNQDEFTLETQVNKFASLSELDLNLVVEPAVGQALSGEAKLRSLGEIVDPDSDIDVEKTPIVLSNIGPDIDPESTEVELTFIELTNIGEPFDVDAYLDNLESQKSLREVGELLDPEEIL
ncbi:hypothetical protein [Alishewanella longhuensis]